MSFRRTIRPTSGLFAVTARHQCLCLFPFYRACSATNSTIFSIARTAAGESGFMQTHETGSTCPQATAKTVAPFRVVTVCTHPFGR